MPVRFSRLTINDWRQFEAIDIDLSRPLTVLTGANGAGKTTLLMMLMQSMGWPAQFVAEPSLEKGGLRFLSGLRRRLLEALRSDVPPSGHIIGEITYDDGIRASLRVPEQNSPVFNLVLDGGQSVFGIYVSSHRTMGAYQQVGQLPTSIAGPQQFIDTYENELRQREAGGHTQFTPAYRLKESLISLATFGYGNEVVQRNQQYVAAFEGFQRVLREVLPRSLRFQRIQIAVPEVILETGTGNFSLDAVSGGVSSLVDLAWRVFMRALTDPNLAVVIDEPENHLHPELQRELLPGLLRAFPKAQFIAATHSPFIVGSVRESNVYALRYDEGSAVHSVLLDTINKAASSNEILRDVLGLEFTMPVWVEDRVTEILDRYERQPTTVESLRAMRAEMGALGLAHLFPDAAAAAMERPDDPA